MYDIENMRMSEKMKEFIALSKALRTASTEKERFDLTSKIDDLWEAMSDIERERSEWYLFQVLG